MRSILRLAPAGLAVAIIAFAAVSTDYDHHADFGRIHTYSWIGVRAGGSIWQDRIQRAVDAALTSRGWQRVESGGDADVAAIGHVTEQDTMQTFYDGFPGWGWGGWAGMGEATTTTVPERVGNLTVDIFNGGTKQLIFRGRASDALSSKPEKNDKKMEESVDKMFKDFPPKGKG